MNIALIGYGKMGRTIESLGLDQGHSFPLVIDVDNTGDLNSGNIHQADVAIEFTTPGTAPANIMSCIDLGIPVVSGTTGWNNRYDEVADYCRAKQGAFFYASNFNIGVNILFAMNRQLARIMDRFTAYTVSIKEVHHSQKLDAPSGTAITLAEQIIEQQRRFRRWSLDDLDDPSSITIESVRKGEVIGEHFIRYDSELDSITFSHRAKSRDALAAGALMAAGFIRGKTGIFGMRDLLKL
jgi:4-hydroxy-tetrahydrodipicolinate reductase